MAHAAFPIRRFPSGPLQHWADRRFRYAGRALQTGLLVAGYPLLLSANAMINEPFSQALVA
jgi:hypothetical protein